MPKAKVRPVIVFNWPDLHHHDMHHEPLQLTDNWQDDYGSGNRHDHHYWHARSAFLKSYHFSQENDGGLKKKLSRSVKEINETAMGIVLDIRREMAKRRLGLRVSKIKLALPSLVMIKVRCFTPWLNKKALFFNK